MFLLLLTLRHILNMKTRTVNICKVSYSKIWSVLSTMNLVIQVQQVVTWIHGSLTSANDSLPALFSRQWFSKKKLFFHGKFGIIHGSMLLAIPNLTFSSHNLSCHFRSAKLFTVTVWIAFNLTSWFNLKLWLV